MSIVHDVEDLLAPRRVSNDFRWASRNWAPSPYFVRGKPKDTKEIIQLVLSSEKVRDAIKAVSKKEGKDEREVTKQAQAIMYELAHDFHLYAVRWFGLVLSKLSKKLYCSMFVNTEKLPQLKEAFQSYPVLILPTHRSYVDFLLVSYICFHFELPLPVIAAGMDFMGMTGVGELLRKSGAFFIRRRFGGDVLYWALISEYVKRAVVEGGHPMEMFVEGTRSRSGKSLSPKVGLLSVILDLVWSGEIPDILILPISVSYDRTLEEKLYAHELLGQPKPKESTNGLVKALRWLESQSYGSVYAKFGELISVRQVLQSKMSLPSPMDTIVFGEQVQNIALQVVLNHQKNLVVPLFSVLATVFLNKISRRSTLVDFNELMLYVFSFERLLLSRGSHLGYPLKGQSLENNVKYIISIHSSLVSSPDPDGCISINLDGSETVQCMQLQHYSNQLLPLIVPFSLAALVFKPSNNNNSAIDNVTITPALIEEYCFLRQLFSEDFLYQPDTEAEEFEWAATKLKSIEVNEVIPNKNSSSGFINILIFALEPYFIAYWGMTLTLLEVHGNTNSPCEIKQLGKLCQVYIHEQMKTHLPKQYGALSLDTLTNAISSLVHTFGAAKVKLEAGSYGIVVKDSQLLSDTLHRLEKLLGVDCLGLNTERHSMEPNFKIDSSSRLLQLRSKL